jgi:hypothetical protein
MFEIWKLVSKCIERDHPIVLDIRWRFHELRMEEVGGEVWPREKWERYIKQSCKYTLNSFLKALITDKVFRRNVKRTLRQMVLDCEYHVTLGGESPTKQEEVDAEVWTKEGTIYLGPLKFTAEKAIAIGIELIKQGEDL